MSDDRFEQIAELFQNACGLSPDERAAYLDEACGGDAALREAVERLVAGGPMWPDDAPGGWSEATRPAPQTTTAAAPPKPAPPTDEALGRELGGRYELLERLGQGGFATVYAAQQREPVRRKVAMKVLRAGMDSEQVLARFEVERQALAVMDHPNVARVYDAGTTETGRPYFVMELVAGDPINVYCRRNRLDIPARLDLFLQACEATQHAHQKGIIHRDIKPSNVLVTVREGAPLVKIIDFGIAKAISRELTGRTLYTEQGMFLGTPEYMSPEQAELTGVDIDTRSDVYSLGVLLYELLTRTLPFDPERLREIGPVAMQRVICEEDPPLPSTRFGDHDDRTVTRHVRGDLDWIVMKALEKDRTRRYETAAALANDVRRHLADEPVIASPPSAAYKTRKFIRRHTVGVSAAAIVALTVLVGAATTTWQAVRATRAEADALAERDRADRRYGDARDLASYFMNDFHNAIVDLPGSLPAREALVDRALEYLSRLHEESADDVSLRLDLAHSHMLVGQILGGLRGPNLDRVDDAMAQYDIALRIHEQLLADEPGNLVNRQGLMTTLLLTADAYRRRGDDEAARRWYERVDAFGQETLAMYPDDGRTTRLGYAAQLKLGDYARWGGDLDEAAEIYGRCLQLAERRARLDPDDARAQRDLTIAHTRLAVLHKERGDLPAALGAYQAVLASRLETARRNPDSVRARRDAFNAHTYVAATAAAMDDVEQARQHFEAALSIAVELRRESPTDERARTNLAKVRAHFGAFLHEAGLTAEAEPLLREALADYEALAVDHPDAPDYAETAGEIRELLAGQG